MSFAKLGWREIEVGFDGGEVSSDGGLLLLRQRVFGLCQGYEDLNDHDTLRNDLAVQTALERDTAGASSPTLCRFENRADRATAVATSRILVEQFIASFKEAPSELIFDFDATDDIVHGNQDGRHFSEFAYAAGSWSRQRRVIVKAEHNAQGANPRFVVTTLGRQSTPGAL